MSCHHVIILSLCVHRQRVTVPQLEVTSPTRTSLGREGAWRAGGRRGPGRELGGGEWPCELGFRAISGPGRSHCGSISASLRPCLRAGLLSRPAGLKRNF